jgi:hypothetical protein
MIVGNAMWARKALAFGLVMATAATVVVLVVATKPAGAAFPGSNGKIAFHSASSIVGGDPSATDTEIFTMNANGTGLTQLTVNAVKTSIPPGRPMGRR